VIITPGAAAARLNAGAPEHALDRAHELGAAVTEEPRASVRFAARCHVHGLRVNDDGRAESLACTDEQLPLAARWALNRGPVAANEFQRLPLDGAGGG